MKFSKIFLCLTILISSVNCAYAAEDGGVSEALRQVKERVDTSEYTDFKSNYYKNEDGKAVYYFTWTKGEDENSELYIEFDNGIITNYGKYDYNYETVDAFSITEADANMIAREFLERINPDISDNIEIVPQDEQAIGYDGYEVGLYRKEAGIPVLGQTGYITVSKKNREVTSFYINYAADVEFKPLDNLISEEAAKAAYKKLIPPTLRYKFKRDYSKKTIAPYLEYAPKDSDTAINAYDGSVYEIYQGSEAFYGNGSAAKEEMRSSDTGFTPAEIEETERIAGLLSEETAAAIVKNNEIVGIPANFEQEYASLNRDWFNNNQYIYNFGFSNEELYASASVDAKSGEILSFYSYGEEDKEDNRNREREKQSAEKAFKALAGEKAAEFRLEEDGDGGAVIFVRTFDGLDVTGDNAYFFFDGNDKIISYSLTYTKEVSFPSKNGVVSAEAAADTAFDKLGFGLAYALSDDGKTALPIYCLGKNGSAESFMLNPFTLQFMDYSGNDVKINTKLEYSDIENHYGKDAFNALAGYGIGFEGGELKPDDAITQAEYFTLLNSVFGYGTELDEIYRQMVASGTISADERADNSVLTRENAAIFMVREIGAEEYAKYNDIYAPPFSDVTENKGYIAILKAKGILNGDGSGNFYPQRTVTRGEALIMIYNYFAK